MEDSVHVCYSAVPKWRAKLLLLASVVGRSGPVNLEPEHTERHTLPHQLLCHPKFRGLYRVCRLPQQSRGDSRARIVAKGNTVRSGGWVKSDQSESAQVQRLKSQFWVYWWLRSNARSP